MLANSCHARIAKLLTEAGSSPYWAIIIPFDAVFGRNHFYLPGNTKKQAA